MWTCCWTVQTGWISATFTIYTTIMELKETDDWVYRNWWLTIFCQHILASDVQAAKPTDEVRCDLISTLDPQTSISIRLGRFPWTGTCCCCWDQDMFILMLCWFPLLNINCNDVSLHLQIQNCSVQPGSVKEKPLLRLYDSISACDVCIYYPRLGKHINSSLISYIKGF